MLEQARLLERNEESVAVAPRATPRLLVIDDDKLHRMIICRVAARVGYAPAGAASYDEAINLTRETAFDCITLDLSLGPHAGVEMLHHLRVIDCKASIIVISGGGEVMCKETVKLAKSLNLNIWETMSKPVDLTVLRQWFERLKSAESVAVVAAA